MAYFPLVHPSYRTPLCNTTLYFNGVRAKLAADNVKQAKKTSFKTRRPERPQDYENERRDLKSRVRERS